jgi:Ca2+-binding EF-hand superfamily protein
MSSKRLSLGTHFLSTKKKTDLSELFASFDKDNDDKLSHSELQAMLQSAGIDSAAIPSMVMISFKRLSVKRN